VCAGRLLKAWLMDRCPPQPGDFGKWKLAVIGAGSVRYFENDGMRKGWVLDAIKVIAGIWSCAIRHGCMHVWCALRYRMFYRIYASNDPTFKCTDHMKVGSVLRKTFALA
jgi:hypothetical protein